LPAIPANATPHRPPASVGSRADHVSGTIKGVARIYNRNQYSIDRKTALDAWGRHIESLVYPERAKSNVVAMRPVAAT
jgi:hypothetical protein